MCRVDHVEVIDPMQRVYDIDLSVEVGRLPDRHVLVGCAVDDHGATGKVARSWLYVRVAIRELVDGSAHKVRGCVAPDRFPIGADDVGDRCLADGQVGGADGAGSARVPQREVPAG